tara:strand:+ start:2182 stop:2688 length:507 start_codon:yes stop_codon:yes gene_type:complete
MPTVFICSIISLFFSLHNFHITHTTLHYNASKSAIEITIKVAAEDLERALEDKGLNNLRIGADNEAESAHEAIIDYLRQHLKISPNDKPAEYIWVGKELSRDMHDLYIYCEILDCNKNGQIKSLSIENTLFTEIISEQSNITLIEFGENNQSLTFTKQETKQRVTVIY